MLSECLTGTAQEEKSAECGDRGGGRRAEATSLVNTEGEGQGEPTKDRNQPRAGKAFVVSAMELSKILEDKEYREGMLKGYEEIGANLGTPGVSERVGKRMIELLKADRE